MTTPLKLPYFQVDAFTSRVFGGNPAGVCPLGFWPDDHTLQSIAAENNLSETAFFVKQDAHYELRWFTPAIEVDLCGHATLASAFVIFKYLDTAANRILFNTKSGELTVTRSGHQLTMDFPSRPGTPVKLSEAPQSLVTGLGNVNILELYKSRDYLIILDNETHVRKLQPDFSELSKTESLGIIVSAQGEKTDFVSRFFAPRAGINEDPVTGSAHCTLTPYWSEKLGKTKMTAHQMSPRGGELYCEHIGDRVNISGTCALYLEGTIFCNI